jgi:hypothetical protein
MDEEIFCAALNEELVVLNRHRLPHGRGSVALSKQATFFPNRVDGRGSVT